MTMVENKYESVTEEWKNKEYEKIKISGKLMDATRALGICYSYPSIDNIKKTFGLIIDYIVAMPIQDSVAENSKKKRELLVRMDTIQIALFGNPDDKETRKICSEMGVIYEQKRDGLMYVWVMKDAPKILIKLKDIINEAGELALVSGIRISQNVKRKYGMSKIAEEEGFNEEELDSFGDNDDESDAE
jgi:DNA-binding phage protein